VTSGLTDPVFVVADPRRFAPVQIVGRRADQDITDELEISWSTGRCGEGCGRSGGRVRRVVSRGPRRPSRSQYTAIPPRLAGMLLALVPEPSSFALMIAGLVSLLWLARAIHVLRRLV
jgi:hypothetical protein